LANWNAEQFFSQSRPRFLSGGGVESLRPEQVIAMCFQVAGLDSRRSSGSMDNKDKVKFLISSSHFSCDIFFNEKGNINMNPINQGHVQK
jgi:hypothetical protein